MAPGGALAAEAEEDAGGSERVGTEEQQGLLGWEMRPGSALPLFLLTHPRISNFDLNRDQSGHETFFLLFPIILSLPYEHRGPPWYRAANPNHEVV